MEDYFSLSQYARPNPSHVLEQEGVRYEIRFVVPTERLSTLSEWIKQYGSIDQYSGENGYQIYTRYLAGWKAKQEHGRLRLRSYSCSSADGYFLEEKIKRNCTVQKNRIAISEEVALQLETVQTLPQMLEVARASGLSCSPMLVEAGSTLSLAVSYIRHAWFVETPYGLCRVTIDTNSRLVTAVNEERSLFGGTPNDGVRLLPSDVVILELKGNRIQRRLQERLDVQLLFPCNHISKFRLANASLKASAIMSAFGKQPVG